MNYEEFYQETAGKMNDLKASANAVSRLQKAVQKDIVTGDLNDLKKVLSQLAEACALLAERTAAASDAINAFDTRAYFISGEFAKDLVKELEDRGVDVNGGQGIYEVFPYKVRIVGDDERSEEVWINRKKSPSFRPSYIAETIHRGREKLYKMKFNDAAFANELAEAYSLCCLRDGLRDGTSIPLTKLYKILTPMARARKEYDMQAFAFDLARMYEHSDSFTSKDGRCFLFGPSRVGKGIRVLSSSGVESYIETLSSIRKGEDNE